MTNELKDVDMNDTVPYERDDNMMTKVKWSTEMNDIDDRFLRDYENMHKWKIGRLMIFMKHEDIYKVP